MLDSSSKGEGKERNFEKSIDEITEEEKGLYSSSHCNWPVCVCERVDQGTQCKERKR